MREYKTEHIKHPLLKRIKCFFFGHKGRTVGREIVKDKHMVTTRCDQCGWNRTMIDPYV